MKLSIEVDEEACEEITIRCRKIDARVLRAEKILKQMFDTPDDLCLLHDNTECFVPASEILFFETDGSARGVAAYTKERKYHTDRTLAQLEAELPYSFIRASKSCILNAMKVSAIARNLTGASEVSFRSSDKHTYVSRSYYKPLKERITELRLR